MLLTFLFGAAAGLAVPYSEGPVKNALESVLLAEAPMSVEELRLFTFALLLLAAALLAALFGGGSSIALAFGGVVGAFGPRIVARIQSRKAPDYGDDAE